MLLQDFRRFTMLLQEGRMLFLVPSQCDCSAAHGRRQHQHIRRRRQSQCCRAQSAGQDPLLVRVARGEGEASLTGQRHTLCPPQQQELTSLLMLQRQSGRRCGSCGKRGATWPSSASAHAPLAGSRPGSESDSIHGQCCSFVGSHVLSVGPAPASLGAGLHCACRLGATPAPRVPGTRKR